jgi:hypothetical protein
MGLLEYKAIPSLRDVAYDGVLCTFSNRPAQTRAYGAVRQGTILYLVYSVERTVNETATEHL